MEIFLIGLVIGVLVGLLIINLIKTEKRIEVETKKAFSREQIIQLQFLINNLFENYHKINTLQFNEDGEIIQDGLVRIKMFPNVDHRKINLTVPIMNDEENGV